MHGSQEEDSYRTPPYAVDFPHDLTDIKAVQNSETQMIENLIFVSASNGDIAIIPEQYNPIDEAEDFIASVKIR